ncbi:tyrosine-type recombinase/integrase [Bacillus sp. CGMCC 1.16607]|uniref:tyrosine-type recombinase/integrase n=1 Tax=Bacillus sp. CGMCC 1.16607 TaxID=3351842 RepID=UPI00363BFB57
MMNQIRKYSTSTIEVISKPTRTILNEYLLNLQLANKTEATIKKYRWILERFFRECPIPIDQLHSDDVQHWLIQFSTGKKARIIDLFLSTLTSFFQFCLEKDYIKKTVMKKRWRPKISPSLPQFLNKNEYAKVMLAAKGLSLRDQALVLFLFSSGCRQSEVSNLSIEDVYLDQQKANVKGKKIRQVHFSKETAIVLKDYLQTRSYVDTDPLFLNHSGGRLHPTSIYEITIKLGRKAGISQRLNPRVCRQTFAMNMFARGTNIEFISNMKGGHKSLNSTPNYLRIPTEAMILHLKKMGYRDPSMNVK